jgi:hypothetical protein
MSDRELRCYDYVNRSYAVVREALLADPIGIFLRATRGASSRAEVVAASLRTSIGPIEVGADIAIQVAEVTELTSPFGTPMTSLRLEWQAVRGPGLFPSMNATLSIYALSATETQLDLHGLYRPPLGFFGTAVDALVGYRVAEATVLRFVQEIAEYLRASL